MCNFVLVSVATGDGDDNNNGDDVGSMIRNRNEVVCRYLMDAGI